MAPARVQSLGPQEPLRSLARQVLLLQAQELQQRQPEQQVQEPRQAQEQRQEPRQSSARAQWRTRVATREQQRTRRASWGVFLPGVR